MESLNKRNLAQCNELGRFEGAVQAPTIRLKEGTLNMSVKSQKSHRDALRFTALVTAFVFTVTSVSWSTPVNAAPADSAAAVVLPIDKLTIPAEMGTMRLGNRIRHDEGSKANNSASFDIHDPRSEKFVVLVQDAHAIIDAQENIKKILMYLGSTYGIRLTALEGAKGRLEPILFRTFPDTNVLKKVLANYESRAELSGPELASVFQEETGDFFGMEDWKLYETNYAAYLAAQDRKEALLAKWKAVKQELDRERVTVYDEKLNEFHAFWDGFLAERVSLMDLMLYLVNFQPLFDAQQTPVYTELPQLIQSLGYEKTGSQEALAPQVRKIADEFKRKYLRGLGVKTEMNFYSRYQAFLNGEISAGEMLQYLVRLGSEYGKKPKLTPQLLKLLGHTETLSAIKGSVLYEELDSFIPEAEASLIQTKEQSDLAQKYRKLFLMKNLIELELTHPQLARYQKEPEAYLRLFEGPGKLEKSDRTFEENLTPAVEFYEAALQRDQAFLGRIDAKMKKNSQKMVAVVAGGFHTSGLEKILKEQGIPYAVVTPRITELAGVENYDRVMKSDVSFKDYLKTSYFDALMRHAADALAEALPIPDRMRALKNWRDNMIRELAKDGRIVEAGKYLPYIDGLLHGMTGTSTVTGLEHTNEEIFKAVKNELQNFKKSSFERIWKTFEFQLGIFTEGLKELVIKKELTTDTIASLLDRASSAKPAMLAIPTFLDPSIMKPVPEELAQLFAPTRDIVSALQEIAQGPRGAERDLAVKDMAENLQLMGKAVDTLSHEVKAPFGKTQEVLGTLTQKMADDLNEKKQVEITQADVAAGLLKAMKLPSIATDEISGASVNGVSSDVASPVLTNNMQEERVRAETRSASEIARTNVKSAVSIGAEQDRSSFGNVQIQKEGDGKISVRFGDSPVSLNIDPENFTVQTLRGGRPSPGSDQALAFLRLVEQERLLSAALSRAQVKLSGWNEQACRKIIDGVVSMARGKLLELGYTEGTSGSLETLKTKLSEALSDLSGRSETRKAVSEELEDGTVHIYVRGIAPQEARELVLRGDFGGRVAGFNYAIKKDDVPVFKMKAYGDENKGIDWNVVEKFEPEVEFYAAQGSARAFNINHGLDPDFYSAFNPPQGSDPGYLILFKSSSEYPPSKVHSKSSSMYDPKVWGTTALISPEKRAEAALDVWRVYRAPNIKDGYVSLKEYLKTSQDYIPGPASSSFDPVAAEAFFNKLGSEEASNRSQAIAAEEGGRAEVRDAAESKSTAEISGTLQRLYELRTKIESDAIPEILSVGDKHGQSKDLESVLKTAEEALLNGKELHVIIHGDAFDRGKNNARNWEILRKLKEIARESSQQSSKEQGERDPKIKVDMLLGNHDALLIQAMLLSGLLQSEAYDDWFTQGGASTLTELGAKGVEGLAFWMLQNFKLFTIDERGFLHVHAGIHADKQGNPLITRKDLEGMQENLEKIQRDLGEALRTAEETAKAEALVAAQRQAMSGKTLKASDTQVVKPVVDKLGPALRGEIALFFIRPRNLSEKESFFVYWARESDWLQNFSKDNWVNRLITLWNRMNARFPRNAISLRVDRNKVDRFLGALGVNGVVFGHNHMEKLWYLNDGEHRLFCVAVELGDPGHLRFTNEGIQFKSVARDSPDLVVSKSEGLLALDDWISRLEMAQKTEASRTKPGPETVSRSEVRTHPATHRFSFSWKKRLWFGGVVLALGLAFIGQWRLTQRWADAASGEYDPGKVEIKLVVGEKNIQEILKSGKGEYVSNANPFQKNKAGINVPTGFVRENGVDKNPFNPNSRGWAMAKAICLVDGNGYILIIPTENFNPSDPRYSADKYPHGFQAGPMIIINGALNPKLEEWYPNLFAGRKVLIGADESGKPHTLELSGMDILGQTGLSQGEFIRRIKAWSETEHIQNAFAADGGNTGDKFSHELPPTALMAFPRPLPISPQKIVVPGPIGSSHAVNTRIPNAAGIPKAGAVSGPSGVSNAVVAPPKAPVTPEVKTIGPIEKYGPSILNGSNRDPNVIEAVQIELLKKGYKIGKADKKFGPKTREALKAELSRNRSEVRTDIEVERSEMRSMDPELKQFFNDYRAGLRTQEDIGDILYPNTDVAYQMVLEGILPVMDKNSSFLEVGVGSGIVTAMLAAAIRKNGIRGVKLVGTDKNPRAVEVARKMLQRWGAEIRPPGYLFEPLLALNEKFDVIFWNPPWFSEQWREKQYGEEMVDPGYQTVLRFIREMPEHLKSGGRAYILFPVPYFESGIKPHIDLRLSLKDSYVNGKGLEIGLYEWDPMASKRQGFSELPKRKKGAYVPPGEEGFDGFRAEIRGETQDLGDELASRLQSAGMLNPILVRYWGAIRKSINQDQKLNTAVVGAAGAGISELPLILGDSVSEFFLVDTAYGDISVRDLNAMREAMAKDPEGYLKENLHERYKSVKANKGYSNYKYIESKENMLAAIALELQALGVDFKEMKVEKRNSYPQLKFSVKYANGEVARHYTLILMNADIADPVDYPASLKAVLDQKVDVYFHKASYEITQKYDVSRSFIHTLYDGLRDGGYFVTNDWGRNRLYRWNGLGSAKEEMMDFSSNFPEKNLGFEHAGKVDRIAIPDAASLMTFDGNPNGERWRMSGYGWEFNIRQRPRSEVRVDAAKSFEQAVLRVKGDKIPLLVRHFIATQIGPGMDILEMGVGSGVLTQELVQGTSRLKGVKFTGVDSNSEAVRIAQETVDKYKNVTILESDLFSAFKNGEKFDVVFWNPPWFSKEEGGVLALAKSDPGFKTLLRFLEEAPGYLKRGGKIFLIMPEDAMGEIWEAAAASYEIEGKGWEKTRNYRIGVYELTPKGAGQIRSVAKKRSELRAEVRQDGWEKYNIKAAQLPETIAADLAVLSPVFNEESQLQLVIDHAREAGYLDRMIFVDDASSDRTVSILEQNPDVFYVSYSMNRQKEGAIQKTVEYLKEYKKFPPYFVSLDGDSFLDVRRGAVTETLRKIAMQMNRSGEVARPIDISGQVSEKSNFVEWVQAVQWYFMMKFRNIRSHFIRGTAALLGGGVVFNTEKFLEAMAQKKLGFAAGDLELGGIISRLGETGMPVTEVTVKTEVLHDWRSFLQQRERWYYGTWEAAPGSMLVLTLGLDALVGLPLLINGVAVTLVAWAGLMLGLFFWGSSSLIMRAAFLWLKPVLIRDVSFTRDVLSFMPFYILLQVVTFIYYVNKTGIQYAFRKRTQEIVPVISAQKQPTEGLKWPDEPARDILQIVKYLAGVFNVLGQRITDLNENKQPVWSRSLHSNALQETTSNDWLPHDFRGILHLINGYWELYQMSDGKTERAEYLKAVRDALAKASEIIEFHKSFTNDLLRISAAPGVRLPVSELQHTGKTREDAFNRVELNLYFIERLFSEKNPAYVENRKIYAEGIKRVSRQFDELEALLMPELERLKEQTPAAVEARPHEVSTAQDKSRAELRLMEAPLKVLAGSKTQEAVAMARKADPDMVRKSLLQAGRTGMVREETEFDKRQAELERTFSPEQLPQLLVRFFERYGMTDALANEMTRKVMPDESIRVAELTGFVDADILWNREALAAMAKDREMMKMINDLRPVDPHRSYDLMTDWLGDADGDLLKVLKSLDPARLMLLFDKSQKMVLNEAWREVAPVLPVGYHANDAKAVMERAIKKSDGVLFLSRQIREFVLGSTYMLTLEDQRIATPELRELALEVARTAILIFMAQDKKTQQAIIAYPEMMLPLLKQYGVMSCVQIGRNGQLFVNIEALVSAYVTRQAVEKAA